MSFNINKHDYNSSSIISFKEHFTTYANLSSIQFTEEWGWFIDIESSHQGNYPLTNKYPRQTITEIPSIRSFKSMRNLHNEAMIFKMDDNIEKLNCFKHLGCLIHSVWILGIIGIIYECKLL